MQEVFTPRARSPYIGFERRGDGNTRALAVNIIIIIILYKR